MRAVGFTVEAEEEAREAFAWYRARDRAAANRFEACFVEAVARIAEAPSLGPEIEPGIRRQLLPPFPYALLYEVEPARVTILTVMHTRRRPGFWRGRAR